MEAFYEFAIASPWLAFIAICAIYYTLKWIIFAPFRMVNRICRSRNIVARGWPPPHLDADGDFKPENTE